MVVGGGGNDDDSNGWSLSSSSNWTFLTLLLIHVTVRLSSWSCSWNILLVVL